MARERGLTRSSLWSCATMTLLGAVAGGCSNASASSPPATGPRAPVAGYLEAFNAHSFANAADFASPDWTFISPIGARLDGRDAVVQDYATVEAAVLVGVGMTLKKQSVVYASETVAVVTATDILAPFPTGEDHERLTFVVVNDGGTWLIHQLQVTDIADESLPTGPAVEEAPVPTDVGGGSATSAENEKAVRDDVTWYWGLPVSHAFDAADTRTTEDWNQISPVGAWYRNRTDSIAGISQAFTTFLNGVSVTDEDTSVRFPTADVAIVTGKTLTGPYVVGGAAHDHEEVLSTSVVVNHGGNWLLMHSHHTILSN